MAKKKKKADEIEDIEEVQDTHADVADAADSDFVDGSEDGGKKKDKKRKKAKKRGKAGIVILIVFILLVAGLVAVIWFNPMGLRDKYLNDFMRKIPIVGRFVPDPPEAVVDEFSGMTNEDYVAEIKSLRDEIQIRDEKIAALESKSDENIKEISRLKKIEDEQLQFIKDKQEFDASVALQDTKAFEKFYEKMNPDNAAELYKQVFGINISSKELKSYVATVSSMDEGDAADSLVILMKTDMDLVVLIMENLDSEMRANILGEMQPKDAATLLKRMAPTTQNQ